jgi:hypothetical protein
VDAFDPDDTQDSDQPAFRSKGSPVGVVVGAFVCLGAGVWAIVSTIGNAPWFLPFCLAWIVFSGWWTCFAFSYDATLMCSGEIHARSLCRRHILQVTSVTRIHTSSGGEGGTILVIESRDGTVRLSGAQRNFELARHIKTTSPAIELDV